MDWLLLGILAGVLLLLPTAYAAKIGAPYVPVRGRSLEQAFQELGIGSDDVVVDLGAGDGKVLRAAAAHGATTRGYELSPLLWPIAWFRSRGLPKNQLIFGNFYKADLSDATIVYAFLVPNTMPRLKQFLATQTIPHSRYLLSFMFPFKDVTPLKIIRSTGNGPIYVYDLRLLTKK